MLKTKIARDGDPCVGQECPGCKDKIVEGQSVLYFNYWFLDREFGVPTVHVTCLDETLRNAPSDQSLTEAVGSIMEMARG